MGEGMFNLAGKDLNEPLPNGAYVPINLTLLGSITVFSIAQDVLQRSALSQSVINSLIKS